MLDFYLNFSSGIIFFSTEEDLPGFMNSNAMESDGKILKLSPLEKLIYIYIYICRFLHPFAVFYFIT